MMSRLPFLLAACGILLSPSVRAQSEPVPLVASFSFEDAGGHPKAVDTGSQHLSAELQNVTVVPGRQGSALALHFDGPGSKVQIADTRLDEMLANFTVTCWVDVERFPAKGGVYLVSKGGNSGWQLGLGDAQQVYFHGSWGGGWVLRAHAQSKVPQRHMGSTSPSLSKRAASGELILPDLSSCSACRRITC